MIWEKMEATLVEYISLFAYQLGILESVTFHTKPLERDTIDTLDTFLYSKKYLFN